MIQSSAFKKTGDYIFSGVILLYYCLGNRKSSI